VAFVLIGPPASGKSRIGKRLARKLDVGFVDTDKLIVKKHGPIADIFAEHGEPHFRAIEREEVARALTSEGVVSFGGGAVLDPRTQADLAGHQVVLLTVRPEAVAERLESGKRPLVRDLESWIALFEQRRPLYESLAGFTIDTTNRPTEEIAAEIAAWLLPARTLSGGAKENS
jgi:shikimate kinase